MEDKDLLKFHEERLAEMPVDLVLKAAKILYETIEYDDKEIFTKLYNRAEDKGHWFADHHFFAGMAIRNLLRQEGLTDDMLPSGNWDDYYLPCFEIAIGVRPFPGFEIKKVTPEDFFGSIIE